MTRREKLRGVGVVVALMIVALLILPLIEATLAAPRRAPLRDVRMWSTYRTDEFSGSNCTSGWQWNDAGFSDNKAVCQTAAGTVRIKDEGPEPRAQGMLWHNDMPSPDKNIAIEARFKYVGWHGYGTDGIFIFEEPYSGERRCYDHSAGGGYYGDPECPEALPEAAGHSHAQGAAGDYWRSVKFGDRIVKYDTHWYDEGGQTNWIIARWEYTASSDTWDLYVYRTNDTPSGSSAPYHWDQSDHDGHYTSSSYGAPEAVRLGHHIYYTGQGDGDSGGPWTDPVIDYVRIWTWETATPTPLPELHVQIIDPDGNEVATGGRIWAIIADNWSSGISIAGCKGCSSLDVIDADLSRSGDPGTGLWYEKDNNNQVVLGITPIPDTGVSDLSGVVKYYWQTGWNTGSHYADIVIVTKTPSPTPTPWPTSTPLPNKCPSNTEEVTLSDFDSGGDTDSTTVTSLTQFTGGSVERLIARGDLIHPQMGKLIEVFVEGERIGGYFTGESNCCWTGIDDTSHDISSDITGQSSFAVSAETLVGVGDVQDDKCGTSCSPAELKVCLSLQEQATKTPTPTPIPPAEANVQVFQDDDGDGTWDSGEPGLSDIAVTVGSDTKQTNSSGKASFSSLSSGSYQVSVDESDADLPSGVHLTTDNNPTTLLLDAGSSGTVSFGFQPLGEIRAHVFRDDDGDGTQDSGEPGLQGIRVDVIGESQDTTNSSGIAYFSEVPGSYTVRVDDGDSDLPAGSVLTTNGSQSVNLLGGATEHVYFGFQPLGTVEEMVYLDQDSNGTYDPAVDDPLGNVSLDLTGPYGYADTITTDASGWYSVDVPAGTYTLRIDESDPDIPAGALRTEGDPPPVSLTVSGGDAVGERYGYAPLGDVQGIVFVDEDGDGTYDAGESGWPSVDVDVTGPETRNTTTSGNGEFAFLSVQAGHYDVEADEDDLPTGATATTANPQSISVSAGGTTWAYIGFAPPPPRYEDPDVDPFLHLKTHNPPYTGQHKDYRNGTRHKGQVFIHAVPAAEVTTMPRYCEYVLGTGWTCTEATDFAWTGYAFTGVRRKDTDGVEHWCPSPVGIYARSYTSPTHPFNPTPHDHAPAYDYPYEYTNLYFAFPGTALPECPTDYYGSNLTCIYYEDRAPGVENLEFDLYGTGDWGGGHTRAFTMTASFPITLTKSRPVYHYDIPTPTPIP